MREIIKNAIKSGPIPVIRNWRELPVEELSRAERVMKFIESFVKVPEGPMVGQPFRLVDFQEAFIYSVYDNEVHTSTAILSIARKNGKTGLIAALILAHLVGPEAVLNSQMVSGAQSRDQASLVRKLAIKAFMQSPVLSKHVESKNHLKTLLGKPRNTEFVSLSADAKTNMGISPVFALLDEVGQVKGDTSEFVEAITTSQGAYDNPILVVISTQAPSDADMLSTWIDDAIIAGDPKIVCHVYEAPENADLLDKEAWRASNPALGIFRSEADLEKQLEKAKRLPSLESSNRNLLLNQRVALEKLFIPATVWRANNAEPDPEIWTRPGQKIAMGLDLSARNDLTAAVLAAQDEEGFVHLKPYVFCPSQGIEERSSRDRAPYATWVEKGFMIPLGGATVDYEQIVTFLHAELHNIHVDVVAFDRWRIEQFQKACKERSLFQGSIWQKIGQGYKDQSPSLENFLSLLLAKRIKHGSHPLLNMAASNAIAVNDPAGSVKIDKSKSTQRIDPLIAAHQAVFEVTEGDLTSQVDVSAMIG